MTKLDEIIKYNENFVLNKTYEPYIKKRKNNKNKITIISCMDTRLTELLPKALNINYGDAKIIKNAGASIIHPYGNTIRSTLITIYEFNVKEIFVIGHKDCGMTHIKYDKIVGKMNLRGINLNEIETNDINLKLWLKGFKSVKESIKQTCMNIISHPLIPNDIYVHGLIIDPTNGKLELVINGYNKD